MKCMHVVIAALVLFLVSTVSRAATMVLPGNLNDGAFVPDKDAKGPFATTFAAVTADVSGSTAAVSVRETVLGPESATAVAWIMPLPPGVDGTKGKLTVADAPAEVKVLSPETAQKLYESIAKETGSPAILSYSGRAAVVATFKLKDKTEIAFSYSTPIRQMQGVSVLDAPMPNTAFTRGPVERVSLTGSIKADKPIRAAFSPTHGAVIDRKALTEAAVTFKADSYAGGDDFRLAFVADNDDLGLRLLTYRDASDPDGYFMLLGNPTGSASQKPVEKDMLLVLDTSGSMRGEKIEQARAAIDYCLTHLNPGDRFNIVTFGTEVSTFRSDLRPNAPAEIAAAREYIDNVIANGRTNISGALAKAFAGASDPRRPRIMMFLTDGTPTAGELKMENILAAAAAANTSHTRVFVVGVGNDVNTHLLDKLAEDTEGTSEYIAPNEEIDVKVATLYDRLSNPVLTQAVVDMGELKSFSVYPRKLPALFKGSEIMIVGQYHSGGPHTVSITGMLNGTKMTYTATANFPEKPADTEAAFIAPLWATRKIGFLLSEIRLHSDKPESNKELVEEVVRLSKKYGIVTEYTDFIAAAPGMTAGELVAAAKDRMAGAGAQQAGQWAVNQSKNERELQNRAFTNASNNAYVDRSGKVVSNDMIRQAGNRTYYLRDGQWADSEEAGQRKSRTVKYMSEEYLKLIRENKDFAKAQELGWAMSVNVGEERIVVERDGKTSDEQLKKPVAPEPVQDQGGPNEINNLNLNGAQQLRNLNQIPQQQIRN
jgi:Ca-activated chloride channel homolog